jgi:hypothetical protein
MLEEGYHGLGQVGCPSARLIQTGSAVQPPWERSASHPLLPVMLSEKLQVRRSQARSHIKENNARDDTSAAFFRTSSSASRACRCLPNVEQHLALISEHPLHRWSCGRFTRCNAEWGWLARSITFAYR